MAPVVYRIRITSGGFTPFTDPNIDVVAGAEHRFAVRLQFEESKQNITISDAAEINEVPRRVF